jgi:dTDP-4-amino-4,6-dideoxygalactose transaminase
MQAFARLKKEYGFVWIQDACHSPGAQWLDDKQRWWKTSEWPVPDMTVYSFHPVKHITAGEGGMITTHSLQLDKMLRLYRTHGITKDAEAFMAPEHAFSEDGEANPWYYEMQVLGYNYRLSDIQAALGESQLSRLNTFIARRQQVAELYYKSLADITGVSLLTPGNGIKHAYHLFIVRIDFDRIKKSRARVMKELRAKGIGTQVHYIPVPLMPYYAKDSCLAEIPEAMAYYRQALTLPCFYKMTDDDVIRVCKSLKEVVA